MPALASFDDTAGALAWLQRRGVRALCTDSRQVRTGDAFIAWPGYANDARQFVPQALAAGAAACLVEAKGVEHFRFADERVAALAGLKAATGELASAYLGHPSQRLHVLAVTGTNGKTSVACWLAHALSLLGRRCGVVGTLGVGEPPVAAPGVAWQATGLTTPDPVALQTALRQFADAGCAACAIEASSIGIVEQRLSGTRVEVALFTNFTRDHLDYHQSMDVYWEAKARLFDQPGLRSAVLNIDDERGAVMTALLGNAGLDLWTYGVHKSARLQASAIGYRDGGLAFSVSEGREVAELHTALIGDYNVANLLAVIGGLRSLGVALADAARVCSLLSAVPGRMQQVNAAGGPAVVVDYAHTPDALEKALQALRPFARERGGRLWSVFGCGGNRDASKRPLMGAIAERLADRVVLTSDNPRHESPAAILVQIAAGMAHADAAQVIEDRRAAIAHAVGQAAPDDVILIAGKGHEAEQEVAGVKQPFSDLQEAQDALDRRAAA